MSTARLPHRMVWDQVLEAVHRVAKEKKGHLYKSHFSGKTTLRFSTENVDFESTLLDERLRHKPFCL